MVEKAGLGLGLGLGFKKLELIEKLGGPLW